MDAKELSERFEASRSQLMSVAYRMLGSLSEAEDAVQEAWLRANRANSSDIENPGGWFTTIVARVCLDLLRSRKSRREDPLDTYVPDPIVSTDGGIDPEHEALLAESVSLAMLVVLEKLPPPERVAFVLHDSFGVSFDEIASILGRTSVSTRQLASRARRRVQGADVDVDADLSRQRRAVDAFFAAAREGNFDALLAVLDPDVVLRSDGGVRTGATAFLQGSATVAAQALTYARLAAGLRPAIVNGGAGVVVMAPSGRPFSVIGFTVREGKIVGITALSDPDRLEKLDLSAFEA